MLLFAWFTSWFVCGVLNAVCLWVYYAWLLVFGFVILLFVVGWFCDFVAFALLFWLLFPGVVWVCCLWFAVLFVLVILSFVVLVILCFVRLVFVYFGWWGIMVLFCLLFCLGLLISLFAKCLVWLGLFADVFVYCLFLVLLMCLTVGVFFSIYLVLPLLFAIFV